MRWACSEKTLPQAGRGVWMDERMPVFAGWVSGLRVCSTQERG